MLTGSLLLFALFYLLGMGRIQAQPGAGTVRYVASGGYCGGAVPCYSTIQAAVDASSPGDEIRVAAGAYADLNGRPRADLTSTGIVTQVIYISKTITLRGGYLTINRYADPPDGQANLTLIDARQHGRGLYITGNISPTIENLVITGGYPSRGAPPRWTDVGGGAYIISATATLRHNRFFSNAGVDCGGGIYVTHSRTTLSGNELRKNGAIQGGGLCVIDSDVLVDGNAIHDNQAMIGAGAYMDNAGLGSHSATVRNNQVFSNTTMDGCGGGFCLASGADALINNVIAHNQALGGGSGLCIWRASPRLMNNTLVGNFGGDGSGVYVVNWPPMPRSAGWMTNTILVGHAVGINIVAGNTMTLEATLWGDGVWANGADWKGAGAIIAGTHNYRGDPAFVRPEAGDYHIGRRSAAIDRGVDTGVASDIDGDLRPLGRGYDLGADEYAARAIYLPLVLQ